MPGINAGRSTTGKETVSTGQDRALVQSHISELPNELLRLPVGDTPRANPYSPAVLGIFTLFRDDGSARWWRRSGSSGREYEGGPYVPTLGSVVGAELFVTFEIEVALMFCAYRKDVSDLRPHAEDPGLEAADPVARPAVARDLLVAISNQADKQLLGQEL